MRIDYVSLEASNFKRLDLRTPLFFHDGTTLVSGQNESGKSTILDAIMFGFFSRTVRPKSRPKDEDILAYGSNKASVKLSFAVGDRSFLVDRKIFRNKSNEANLYECLPGGDMKQIAVKVTAVNSEIQRILNQLTFDELVASNIVAQKELNKVVEQRRSDRISIINTFLNLDSFNKSIGKAG